MQWVSACVFIYHAVVDDVYAHFQLYYARINLFNITVYARDDSVCITRWFVVKNSQSSKTYRENWFVLNRSFSVLYPWRADSYDRRRKSQNGINRHFKLNGNERGICYVLGFGIMYMLRVRIYQHVIDFDKWESTLRLSHSQIPVTIQKGPVAVG